MIDVGSHELVQAYLQEEVGTPALVEEFPSEYPMTENEDYGMQMMDGFVSALARTLEPVTAQMRPYLTTRTDHRR